MKNSIKENTMKKVQSFGLFLNKNANLIAVCMVVCVMMCGTVFATQNADTMWATVVGLLQKWTLRLGGAVCFVGGIMIGTGWLSDDPSRKTQGLHVLVGAGIITAVAQIALTLMA